jgi:hypothetical protein
MDQDGFSNSNGAFEIATLYWKSLKWYNRWFLEQNLPIFRHPITIYNIKRLWYQGLKKVG